jgi:hypothetical protein
MAPAREHSPLASLFLTRDVAALVTLHRNGPGLRYMREVCYALSGQSLLPSKHFYHKEMHPGHIGKCNGSRVCLAMRPGVFWVEAWGSI